jgi:superoxide dismutase, Fe-Mn family
MVYDLPPLPYRYGALEPVIDAETMRLHHDKHHRAYVDALNNALSGQPELEDKTIEQLLSGLDSIPEAIRTTVRNQGGGHANHQFFWKVIQPGGAKAPSGALAAEIDRVFGSFATFQERFVDADTRHFGSGRVFLSTNPGGQGLEILTLLNQDSVLPLKKPGLMTNDLWEHAYYLKNQNRRAEYLNAWFDIVNWTTIGARLDAIRRGEEKSLGGPADERLRSEVFHALKDNRSVAIQAGHRSACIDRLSGRHNAADKEHPLRSSKEERVGACQGRPDFGHADCSDLEPGRSRTRTADTRAGAPAAAGIRTADTARRDRQCLGRSAI